jgi:hypothetical protein
MTPAYEFRSDATNSLLRACALRHPQYLFTMGYSTETGRYCLYVYHKLNEHTNIPGVGQRGVARIELAGSSDKDLEVLMTKVVMVCG